MYQILYSVLLATCPVDTRNMITNITFEDYGDYVSIKISGPSTTSKGFFDYARAVNYNPQRTEKEARNYQWIERAIKQAAIVHGGILKYEL